MKKLLYFSSVGWTWIKQRPHFLAEGLAKKGCNITYLAMQHGIIGNNTKMAGTLQIEEPFLLRGYMRCRFIRFINRFLLTRSLQKEYFDAIILTNPIQLTMLPKHLKTREIYYDCMDLICDFYNGRQRRLIQYQEEILCQKATAIFASSLPLLQYLQSTYGLNAEKLTPLFNGYAPESCAHSRTVPIHMAMPSVVYIGTIAEWLDVEALKYLSQLYPELTVYLVGPIKSGMQECLRSEIPNCILTGPLPHEEALAYAAHASAVVIPFIPNRMIEMVDPVKLYEYIALGKAVISSRWAALERFQLYHNLMFYDSPASFARNVFYQIGKSYPPPKRFAAENAWSQRVDTMCEKLQII